MKFGKMIFLAWIIIITTALPAVCFADAGYALQFDGADDIVDLGDNHLEPGFRPRP